MIKLVVCDDQISEQEEIILLLEEYSRSIRQLDIKVFSSSVELSKMEHIIDKTDVFLLDIVMPKLSGIELGKMIRSKRTDAVIIFFTTSRDFALDAFGVHALQYLIKPIEKGALFETLKKAIVMSKKKERLYSIETSKSLVSVKINDIKYIEYKNHLLYFYLKDTIIISKYYRVPFAKAAETLFNDSNFILIHRAILVNMRHIDTMTKKSLKMSNDNVLPVSKSRAAYVKKTYIDFLLKE